MEQTMTETSSNPIPNFNEMAAQIPGAARELLRRGAADARARATDLQSRAAHVAVAIQDAAGVSLSGSALLGQTLLQNAFHNAAATIGMVEKLAGAKCLGEAVNIQLDFVRDYGRTAVEQVRETAGIVQKSFSDSGTAVRGVFTAPKAETQPSA